MTVPSRLWVRLGILGLATVIVQIAGVSQVTLLGVTADLTAFKGVGAWVGYHIGNDQAWADVKSGKLKGFSFSTLERIGGTPSVIVGLASIARGSGITGIGYGSRASSQTASSSIAAWPS